MAITTWRYNIGVVILNQKRLGVKALWISLIFKQVRFQETYHGYGIQNFLEVEHWFGTGEDLQEVVRVAHDNKVVTSFYDRDRSPFS